MDHSLESPRQRVLAMSALVFAGEMVFGLPFHVPRYFRPSVLDTFGLTNADLGDAFAVYGVTAMLAYYPGGALADRFGARELICASLLATALGGFYLATLPGPSGLGVLYGYWGLTTIFLFWAAVIRATREWGGDLRQGRAFGFLDGGRGLAAAASASVAVVLFARTRPINAVALDAVARDQAMREVILFYTAVTFAAAGVVWAWLPGRNHASARMDAPRPDAVLHRPLVWLQALIVVCAYCGYKGLDNYALYVHEVVGMSDAEAAAFAASCAYLRPVAAIAAGFGADRIGAGRAITALFALFAACCVPLAILDGAPPHMVVIFGNLIVSYAAVFALRGVYFALLEEIRVPASMTGTAIGLVSVVGFTPDIFFAPIAGRILDASPGVAGHQHYFMLLAAIAVAGVVIAAVLATLVAGMTGGGNFSTVCQEKPRLGE